MMVLVVYVNNTSWRLCCTDERSAAIYHEFGIPIYVMVYGVFWVNR
jgi:hypothetical protein